MPFCIFLSLQTLPDPCITVPVRLVKKIMFRKRGNLPSHAFLFSVEVYAFPHGTDCHPPLLLQRHLQHVRTKQDPVPLTLPLSHLPSQWDRRMGTW